MTILNNYAPNILQVCWEGAEVLWCIYFFFLFCQVGRVTTRHFEKPMHHHHRGPGDMISGKHRLLFEHFFVGGLISARWGTTSGLRFCKVSTGVWKQGLCSAQCTRLCGEWHACGSSSSLKVALGVTKWKMFLLCGIAKRTLSVDVHQQSVAVLCILKSLFMKKMEALQNQRYLSEHIP